MSVYNRIGNLLFPSPYKKHLPGYGHGPLPRGHIAAQTGCASAVMPKIPQRIRPWSVRDVMIYVSKEEDFQRFSTVLHD